MTKYELLELLLELETERQEGNSTLEWLQYKLDTEKSNGGDDDY